MKHQDKFKKKYGIDAIDFVEKADLEYFGLAKTIGIQSVLKSYAEKKGINIDLNDEFYKHLVEAFAEAGKKFPYNEKIRFDKDLYQLEPTPVNPSIPKSKGVLEDFKEIVADDPLRPQYNAVYVSENRFLYGTDAHKLIKYKNNDYSEYAGKLIDLKTFIASKGKKLDFIDARPPQYDAVIPVNNPNIEKGLPTYNFYNLSKSVITLKKLQDSDIFSIIFDFKGELFGFNPVLMADVFYFALCKGFDTFTLEYSTPNRAMVFKFDKESLGLIMPVMLKEGELHGTTPITINQVVSEYGSQKSAPKKAIKVEKTVKKEVKEVPYKKYEGNFENTSYVPRRDISYLVLRNGEQLSANDIIDGVYRIKKMERGGGVGNENAEMVRSYNKQIAHHTKEMNEAMSKKGEVPAWVVAKMTRSASDLSDATHFMEGKGEEYATGGGVGNDIYYGVIDSNNNLVFQSKNEREAKQVSYSYEGSIVKKYSGKGKIHQYAKGGGVGEIKFEELVGNKFSIKRGSGTKTTTWEKEDLLEEIKGVIKHELFDRDFYYNWTDEGREYSNIFDKYTLNPMLKDIDKTLNEYFVMKKYPNNHTLEFKEHSQGYIDNWFKTNSHISPTLRNDYKRYREKYAGITPYAKGGGVGDCIDFIKKSEPIANNGYYHYFQNTDMYVGSNDKKIPTIKSFYLVTYNSGSQKNIKVTDTINAIELSNEIQKLIGGEKSVSRIILHEFINNAKRIDESAIMEIIGKNIIVADRNNVVCENIKYAEGGGVEDKKEMKLYRIETLAKGNKDVLTDRDNNLYIYEKGILYNTEDGNNKGTSLRMSKINLTILPYKEYAKGGAIGDNVHIMDEKSLMNNKSGVIVGEDGTFWLVKTLNGTGLVKKSKVKVIEDFATGGTLTNEELKRYNELNEKIESYLLGNAKISSKEMTEHAKLKHKMNMSKNPQYRKQMEWEKKTEQSGEYANGGSIGFIPMDLEEKLAITAKWGGTDIKGVIGILNAMIDSGLTDEDLKTKPTKTGSAFQKAIENKTKEIWAKIEPQYKGDFKGNMYYSTISRLVQRANAGDNILNRFKPFRKNQNFATGGGVGDKISEIKAKIEKAKANKIMPEALKKQYIEKYEKELAELEPKKEKSPKKETKKTTKVSKNYDYIPQRDIEQIKAKQGTVENKDILDGAYVKKGWKHKRK